MTVINGETNTVIATPGTGIEPSFIAVNPATNRIYVTNHGSGNVTVIRGSDNAVVQTFSLPGSRSLRHRHQPHDQPALRCHDF